MKFSLLLRSVKKRPNSFSIIKQMICLFLNNPVTNSWILGNVVCVISTFLKLKRFLCGFVFAWFDFVPLSNKLSQVATFIERFFLLVLCLFILPFNEFYKLWRNFLILQKLYSIEFFRWILSRINWEENIKNKRIKRRGEWWY